MLSLNEDKKAVQQKAIQCAKKTMDEYKREQAIINEILARYGAYLKKNSILPVNDAVEAYLRLLIKEAKRIADDTDGDYRRLKGLEVF